MNLYYYALQLSKVFNKHCDIVSYINVIKSTRDQLFVNPQEIIDFNGGTNEKANKFVQIQNLIKNNTANITKIVRKRRPSDVYESVNSLIMDLNLTDHSFNDGNNLIIDFKKLIEAHTDAYSERSPKCVLDFGKICERISISLNDLLERCEFIINNFEENSNIIPDNYAKLALSTDQDIPLLSDFSKVLGNIEDLYNFVCLINKIDYKNNMLIVNHISTGSWLTDLVGAEQAIKSIESLLKSFGNFIRDVITGKIKFEQFEYEVRKNELYIELIKKAKIAGIDNPELGLLKGLQPLVKNFEIDTTFLEINGEDVLDLRDHEKITVLEKKSKRLEIIEQVKQISETCSIV